MPGPIIFVILEDDLDPYTITSENVRDVCADCGLTENGRSETSFVVCWARDLNTADALLTESASEHHPIIFIADLAIDHNGPPQGVVDDYVVEMLQQDGNRLSQVQVIIYSRFNEANYSEAMRRFLRTRRSDIHLVQRTGRERPALRKVLRNCLNRV